jgi:hypothetical protein
VRSSCPEEKEDEIVKRPGLSRPSLRADEGQATLEFVLLIPVIIIAILVVSQSGQMVYRKNILQQAAREGVRVVSTTNSNMMAIQAVIKVCGSKEGAVPDIIIQPGNEGERRLGDIVTISLIDTSSHGALWSIISAAAGKKIFLKGESSMRMECQ